MSITPDDPRLTAYVLDELPADERAAFEQALAHDAAAQAEVDALRELLPALTAALGEDPGATPVATPIVPPLPAPARTGPRWGRLAAALLAGLGLAAGILALREEPPRELRRRSAEEVRRPGPRDTTLPVRAGPFAPAPELAVETDNDLPFEASFARDDTGLAPTVGPERLLQQPGNHGALGVTGRAGGAFYGRGGPAVMDYARRRQDGPDAAAATGGDEHGPLVDEGWKHAERDHTSTFSLDVDTASLAMVRRHLREGRLPPPDAVRIEELVNAFDYGYAPPDPAGEHPLRLHAEVVGCPWTPAHRLVRLAVKAREVEAATRPPLHLVFLVDVSGSMARADRLPLAQHALGLLLSRLEPRDRLSLVTYAGASRVALPSTSCAQRETIQAAIDALASGGSTNGADGLRLAYEQARAAPAVDGAIRRVLLLTDGDFNVGVSDTDALTSRIAEEAATGVWLSVFGFGMGNLKDDRLERLSNRGNGTYAYIDTIAEAQRVLVDDMLGTMITVAKDAKVQVFFNPARVAAWRLMGYANRRLAARDFNDDRKDAGDVGAGHQVTALYEIVPVGVARPTDGTDANPFVPIVVGQGGGAPPSVARDDAPQGLAASPALLRWRLRAKAPEAATSRLQEGDLLDAGRAFAEADAGLQWAAGVAAFGEWLRGSPNLGGMGAEGVLELLAPAAGEDRERLALIDLVRRAQALSDR